MTVSVDAGGGVFDVVNEELPVSFESNKLCRRGTIGRLAIAAAATPAVIEVVAAADAVAGVVVDEEEEQGAEVVVVAASVLVLAP